MDEAPREWSSVERRLWRDYRHGAVCDLSSGDPATDDPADPAGWGPARTVRAEVLARLLLAGPGPVPGTVRGLKLTGALITGRLDLAGGVIESFVELRGCHFDTGVLLSEARAGTVRFDGCWFPRLDASRLATAGDLVLARCTVASGVRLTDAQIGTDLIANYLVVTGDQADRAFSADGLSVHQDFEADRLVCDGQLSLRTARIGGRLSLRGAELHARPGQRNCLDAARITVGNTFYLSAWAAGAQAGRAVTAGATAAANADADANTTAGANAAGAGSAADPHRLEEIGYSLPHTDPGPYFPTRTGGGGSDNDEDSGSYGLPQTHDPRRLNEHEPAPRLTSRLPRQSSRQPAPAPAPAAGMYGQGFGEAPPAGGRSIPFRAYGGVRLEDGRFESTCLIAGAEFHLGEGQELSLRRIQTPELRFTCPTPPTGTVALSRARIGNLVDTPGAWPDNGRVRLTGFAYESLRPPEDVTFTAHQRIAWLDQALDKYRPEPYEQLAAALRRDGRDEDARVVLYAKQRRRRSALPLPGRIWDLLQDVTVGYGYRPGRAALWLVAAWALGTVWFTGHQPPPVKLDEHPHWNAALYALSLVLPIVDLGQDGWAPAGFGQWLSAALVLSGWVLATTAAAGASRLLQRG
ncbi:hypothetical protein GCM10009665_13580 [Kitasatospora nipponensis]|uniref:Oxidoreductase n=1 Tax=Kitasatospora nipponensis TaxID=258049 RepID=A0ABN1VYD3_9ACTN